MKLYQYEIYHRRGIDMNHIISTKDGAFVTRGHVIAEDVDDAKSKVYSDFVLNESNYITNFELGESFIPEPYFQDGNSDVFVEKWVR